MAKKAQAPQDTYEKLGDGQQLDAARNQARFKSRRSADAFKRCHPGWYVTYTRARVGINHLTQLY